MKKSNWAIFVPIYNLEISDEIGGEFRIENVVFLSSKKIPKIRKRLTMPYKISYYNKQFNPDKKFKNLFTQSKVYAFVKSKRSKDDELSREFTQISEAVYLLASSQFYRNKRDSRILFGGPEFSQIIFDEVLLFETTSEKASWRHKRISPVNPYVLNKLWTKFIAHHFFPKIITILNGKKYVKLKWKSDLRKAALLAGQSYFSSNLYESFLYNMIALEILLLGGDGKTENILVERLASLFGWITREKLDYWFEMINHLYQLRCDLVHKGKTRDITIHDVLESDMLLANLLYNLCSLTHIIKGKEDLIKLSEKISARRTLGLRPIERPNKIQFSPLSLSDREIKELEKSNHWSW